MQTLPLEIPQNIALRVSHEDFAAIAAANRDLQLERTADGTLIVNPPTGSNSGRRNLSISAQLWMWAEANDSLGVAFDSSAGFKLPNGAIRAPDAAWIRRDRWEALTQEDKEAFAPLCPDFVVKLCSNSDYLTTLQDKMREYLAKLAHRSPKPARGNLSQR